MTIGTSMLVPGEPQPDARRDGVLEGESRALEAETSRTKLGAGDAAAAIGSSRAGVALI